jgi:hypothetical protein
VVEGVGILILQSHSRGQGQRNPYRQLSGACKRLAITTDNSPQSLRTAPPEPRQMKRLVWVWQRDEEVEQTA